MSDHAESDLRDAEQEDVTLEEAEVDAAAEGEAEAEEEQELENEEDHMEEEDDAEGDVNDEGEHKSNDDGTADASAATSSSRTLKRPLSAYFIFANAVRQQVLADIEKEIAENPDRPKVNILGTVGKTIGEKWKVMTDEEKEPYNEQSKAAKEAYDEAIRADPSLAPVRSKAGSGVASSGGAFDFPLPLGRIKKLMDLDGEKSKVSKDALMLTEKATEQFIQWLSVRSHLHATAQKRKGIRAQDLEHLVRVNSHLEFLRKPLKRDFERFMRAEENQAQERRERMDEMRRKKQKKEEEGGGGEGEEGGETGEREENEDEEGGEAAAAAASKAKPKLKARTIDSMFGRAQ